ncbi:uncharacterized protein [Periplaneta americana]|uniref:uncharacterized protein n=1 Tax=Periplaneta americana TaxID=6978 RepID=UPI0037E99055
MTFRVKCVPVIKNWSCLCCSCTMRTAALILAWLLETIVAANVLMYLIRICRMDTDVGSNAKNEIQYQNLYSVTETKEQLIGATVGYAANLVLIGLMLFGIHKKRSNFMVPYVALNLIVLTVFGVIVFILCIYYLAFLALLFSAVIFGISFFLWLIFYSYYRQLEDERESRANTQGINYNDGNKPDYYPTAGKPNLLA